MVEKYVNALLDSNDGRVGVDGVGGGGRGSAGVALGVVYLFLAKLNIPGLTFLANLGSIFMVHKIIVWTTDGNSKSYPALVDVLGFLTYNVVDET